MRTLVTPIGLAALVLMLGTGVACEDSQIPCACTEEFRFFTVMVLDDGDNPVTDLTITRTNLRTGETLEPQTLALMAPGAYVIADDSMLDEFSDDGDVVRVTGEKAGAMFEASFVFAVPEPCRCHVEQLSGPDTVIVEDVPIP